MYSCHRALLFGVRRKLSLPYRRCSNVSKSHDTVARTSDDGSSPAETIPVEVKSIARGLFVNRVDTSMLIYPEFEESDDLADVEKLADKVRNLMNVKVDSANLDRNRRIPEDVLHGFKKLGLFGMNIPKDFGGLALCNKASSKVYAELSADLSMFTTFYIQNELVGKAISKFGSDEQKRRYLPLLASGSITGAVCFHEDACGEDIAKTETKAVVSENSDRAVLSGTKTWVTNGALADVLVVIAKLDNGKQSDSSAKGKLSALLLDRKSCPGLKVLKRQDTIGLRALEIVDLYFDNVPVSLDCLLYKEGKGFEVAHTIADDGRHHFAAVAAAFLKRLLSVAAKHCNGTRHFGVTLAESNFIQERFAALSLDIFALETIAYYISGYRDDDPSKDYATEGSIAHLFARRAIREGLVTVMEIFGASASTADLEFERLLRDVTTLSSFLGSNDWLVGKIATSGLVTWAEVSSEDLHKQGRPDDHPWHVFKTRFLSRDIFFDTFKLKHHLNEHVHPSLTDACRFIEEVMYKFEHIIRSQLHFKGKAIEDDCYTLKRLCEVGGSIFVMLAAVSRASRSYCIGLKNSDLEVYMAHALCALLKKNSLHVMTELVYGGLYGLDNEDIMRRRIAGAVAIANGYPIVSPLEKNCFRNNGERGKGSTRNVRSCNEAILAALGRNNSSWIQVHSKRLG
ncbi:hypothetical protein M514_07398 [Trichuris suis]|uniref:Acyl-CoA dehydrogenase protein n=1 Tax=Trichuris suis TaxID=68888 RepID=A0A085M3A6_9BILA|nr:hypothetical protein M513_07398 [Trichuris suis]KFD67084.1 hypothetical protein M514_07398 [Trichuris suis]